MSARIIVMLRRPRLLIQLMAAALLSVPLAVAVASLSGVGHRWVDILTQFAAPALTATGLLVLAISALRFWGAALFGLGVLLLLALAVWPQVAPGGPAPARPGGPAVRLYAANLYALNQNVDAMAASIAAADADIVVLVEFGEAPDRAMDTLLRDYPHRHVTAPVARVGDTVRSVIASRHPLSPRDAEGSERQMISAVVQSPVGPLRVVGVHLTRPWPYQYQWGQIIQAQALLDHISDAPEPVVLAGDFNSVATGRIGRMLRAEGPLIHAPGWPGTWPSALPGAFRMTIDQVYHSPDLALTRRSLGRPTGSDHRPVIVELTGA